MHVILFRHCVFRKPRPGFWEYLEKYKNDGIQIFFSVIRRYEIVKTVWFRHQFANDASFGLTIKVIPITHTVRNFYTIFFSRLIVRLNWYATGNDSIKEENVCKQLATLILNCISAEVLRNISPCSMIESIKAEGIAQSFKDPHMNHRGESLPVGEVSHWVKGGGCWPLDNNANFPSSAWSKTPIQIGNLEFLTTFRAILKLAFAFLGSKRRAPF